MTSKSFFTFLLPRHPGIPRALVSVDAMSIILVQYESDSVQ